MKMKKVLMFMLCAILCFQSQAIAAEFTLKAASVNSDTFPPQKAFYEFKDYVEKASKGRISVVRYSDSQLGNINETMEAIQMGIVQLTFPVLTDLAAFDKRLLVVDLPFLFPNFEVAYKALHGELGKKLEPIINGLGFKVCGYVSNGSRSISNNKKPIYLPSDLKGMKIRTMQNQMHIAVFKALTANPTPVSYSELYTALQQGVVDGQENAALLMVDIKLHTIQKYYSLTKHIVSVICPIMDQKWYDALPSDLKKVVDDGLKIYEKKYTAYFDVAEKVALDEMKKSGVKVNELTPAGRAEFQKVAKSVYKDFENVIGKDIIDVALKAVKKYSK